MKKRFFALAALLVLLSGVMFASCSNGKTNAGVADNVTDPFHKYSSTLTMNVGQWVSSETNYPAGQTPGDNDMYDLIEKYTNIDLNASVTVPYGTEFYDKIANLQLTDDLPDMTAMDQNTFASAVEAGQLADLTDAYEKLASPTLKRIMSYQDDLLLNLGKVNGRLYALPEISSPMDGVPVMWIREDWIDIVGWTNSQGGKKPLTYAEFEDLAYTFKEHKAEIEEATGVNGCYSIGFYQDLSIPYYAIMNAHGAYPEIYVEGTDRAYEYGSLQDEMIDGLTTLSKYHGDGLFLADWATRATNTVMQHCASGRVGIMIDVFYGPLSTALSGVMGLKFNGNAKLQNANWIAVPMYSAVEGEDFVPTTIIAPRNYYAMNVNYPNPEALIIMMNYMVEEYNTEGTAENGQGRYFPFTQEFKTLSHQDDLVARTISNWLPFMMYDPEINIEYTENICACLEGDITYEDLNIEEQYFYDMITEEIENTPANATKLTTQWSYEYVYGPEGGIQAYMQYNNRYVYDAYLDVPTPAMQLYENIALNGERTDVTDAITTLVSRDQIASKFNTLKSHWLDNGGEDILEEINS